MSPLELVFVSALCAALSGIPALSARIPVRRGRIIACCFMVCSALSGLFASLQLLLGGGRPESAELLWQLPVGSFLFRFDPLSAFFCIPVLIVSFCVSLYACGYYATTPDNRSESLLTCYVGLLSASLLMVLLSANGVTLLLFWEAMALLAFIALCQEHARPEVRQAGLLYLVASHVATLLVIVTFTLLPDGGGRQFPAPGSLDPHSLLATVTILTAVAGFGLKAGIMPLHIWLPTAHANAPSHVSALMSGVLIKIGIYGIVRVLSFFGTPPLWWGLALLLLGIVSSLCGVLFAIGQHDIKRLLAYHSIENIGIIVMGLGIGQIGLASDSRILFVLGMSGALLHVLNHALFKSLLFLGAGAVVHLAGTRNMERMGGLARALPLTSFGFLIGAVAICGLPPLNGFVSEYLIYVGIFKGFGMSAGSTAAALALAAPALAMTGGLALACFVKVYGGVFLGNSRMPLPEPHESPAMTSAMGLLALACVLIGLLPFAAVLLLEPVVAALAPGGQALLPSLQGTVQLYGLALMAVILIMATIVLAVSYLNRLKSRPLGTTGTWDCGYAVPSASMQYTTSSFAQMLVGIFSTVLRPERHEPAVEGLLPQNSRFESHVPDVVLDQGILPLLNSLDRHLSVVRRLQSGQLNRYILYICVALIVLLVLSDVI